MWVGGWNCVCGGGRGEVVMVVIELGFFVGDLVEGDYGIVGSVFVMLFNDNV